MGMRVDTHEPPEIRRLLAQTFGVEYEEGNINAEGWADFIYDGEKCYCHSSTVYNTERKTWRDLLNLNDIEKQLGRQMDLHPGVHQRLLIEGLAEPAPHGLYIYKSSGGTGAIRPENLGEGSGVYNQIQGWLHQIAKYWEVVYTTSYYATAITISTLYRADNKPEEKHTTLARMFKERNYKLNPQADRILGASGDVPFGEQSAIKVAKRFGTPWRAFKASPQEWAEIPGMGLVIPTRYLRGIGRPDV